MILAPTSSYPLAQACNFANIYDARSPNNNVNTLPANNDSLASLSDLGRSTIALAQGSAGIQPTYLTNGNNGKPAFNFNGSQYMLSSTTQNYASNNTPFTLAVAFTTTTVAAGQAYLFSFANTSNKGISFGRNGSSLNMTGWGINLYNGTSGTLVANQPIAVIYEFTGSAVNFYVNSLAIASTVSASTLAATGCPIYLGAYNGNNIWNGKVFVATAAIRVLTAWEKNSLMLDMSRRIA